MCGCPTCSSNLHAYMLLLRVCATPQCQSRFCAPTFCLHNRSSNAFCLGVVVMHLRLSRQKGKKYLYFCINYSIAARKFFEDLTPSLNIGLHCLRVSPENFNSFLEADWSVDTMLWPHILHPACASQYICERKVGRVDWGLRSQGKLCQVFCTPLCREDQPWDTCDSHPSCLPWEWVWLGRNRIELLKSQGTFLELPSCFHYIRFSQLPAAFLAVETDIFCWLFH